MEEKEIVIHVDWENKEIIVSDDLGTGYEAEIAVDNEELCSVISVTAEQERFPSPDEVEEVICIFGIIGILVIFLLGILRVFNY